MHNHFMLCRQLIWLFSALANPRSGLTFIPWVQAFLQFTKVRFTSYMSGHYSNYFEFIRRKTGKSQLCAKLQKSNIISKHVSNNYQIQTSFNMKTQDLFIMLVVLSADCHPNMQHNKPKGVFGFQVRCRELDIFKIRNFLRNCLEILLIS